MEKKNLTGSLIPEIPKNILNRINEIPKEMTIMDLIVILDGSASVGANNFKIMQDFTLDIIDKMNINEDNIRLCIIQFAEKAKLEINFSNQQNLKEQISHIRYMEGKETRFINPLELATEQFSQSQRNKPFVRRGRGGRGRGGRGGRGRGGRGGRGRWDEIEENKKEDETEITTSSSFYEGTKESDGSARVIIFQTDGDANDNYAAHAKYLKNQMKVKIITIGVGENINDKTLLELSSGKNFYKKSYRL